MDILESKAQKKFLAGLVENRTSDDGLSASGSNEFAVKQGSDDSSGINSADFTDLRNRHRLLVGDDGERFERRKRQPERRLQAFRKCAHYIVLFGFGGHSVSASNLADFYTVVGV